MAEEIINIATLTIDKSQANQSIVDTKAQIFELTKANSELRKDINKNGDATGEQTKKFVENEQALKKLNAQYRTQSAAVEDLTLAELKENKALTEGAKSRSQAAEQTKELKAIRDQLNLTTVEGAQAYDLINKKIDQNDELIKNSGSTQEKAATITGNYRQALFGVDSALSQFGINGEQARNVVKGFGDGITGAAKGVTDFTAKVSEGTRSQLGFKTAAQAANETTVASTFATNSATVANEAQAVSQAEVAVSTNATTLSMRGFAIALAATGIGLVVIALVALVSYLSKLDPVMDKIEKVTSGAAAAFSSLGAAVASLDFSNLIGGMEDAYDAASKLKGAQQDLADLQSSQEVANAKASQQYDELILKSKNRTLSDKERLAFLKQAEKIEEANFKQRSALSDAEIAQALEAARVKGELSKQEQANLKANTVAYATYLLNSGKITQAEYDGIKSAELGKIAIRAESTKRLEKNQNAQDKLDDDAKEKRDKNNADAAKRAEDAAKKEAARKAKALSDSLIVFQTEQHSAEEQLAFYEKYYEKLNALQGGTDKVKNAAELSSKLLEIAKGQIDSEIEAQKKASEDKKTISLQERDDAIANAALLQKIETDRINSSLLNERDKAAALAEIHTGYLETIAVIDTTFEATKKAQEATARQEADTLAAVAFEMRILQLQDQGLQESEVQRQTLAIQLEQKKAALDEEARLGKKTAAEVTALKMLEDKKYAQATKAIDKEVQASKRAGNVGMVKDSIAAATAIFGENKALAIAAALINTYEGISAGVALGYPMAIPAVALAAATGFMAVKNILKTDKGGGSGGGGSAPSSTNTSTATAVFENPTRTQNVASVNAPPPAELPAAPQQILVLETLDEAKGQQQVKINSK